MAVHESITFTDADGEQVTEDWWFQLDETDAIEMDIIHELIKKGDPENFLRNIVEERDTRALSQLIRDMLLASVCKREGKLFIKGPEIVREFRFGGAYRQFFSDLITSDDAGGKFFSNVIPVRVQQKVADEATKVYSNEELLAMNDEDFFKAAGTNDVTEMDKKFLNLAFQRKSSKSVQAA